MGPRRTLAGPALRANVRAFGARGTPVAAVVKRDGYGWGAARIAREIDDLVESYVVADAGEFWALRMHTRRPIRLLEAAQPGTLPALCAHGAIPNVTSGAALEAASACAPDGLRTTVRVGLLDSAGWAAIPFAQAGAFAERCAASAVRVELWSHVASPSRADAVADALRAARRVFADAGVEVAGIDLASTAFATSGLGGDRVRIGAGLFGARLGTDVATTSAIRLAAPVVGWHPPGEFAWAGYGEQAVPTHRGVAVLRCGYGDGFPKELAGYDDILSVGMQYITRLSENGAADHALIDEGSNLDELARRVGLTAHQLIVGLAP